MVTRVQQRIALINGQRFADLTLNRGGGGSCEGTYTIQTVDEDYFSQIAPPLWCGQATLERSSQNAQVRQINGLRGSAGSALSHAPQTMATGL